MIDRVRTQVVALWIVGSLLLASGGVSSACAAEPVAVQFDCGPAVVCRDVTGFDEWLDEGPVMLGAGEKMVEATFRITVRVSEGHVDDLDEITFELFSPGRRARVAGFSPRTHLASDSVDPIRVIRTVEKKKSLGATLGASIVAPAPLRAQITPSVNAGASHRESTTHEHLKISAKHPVIVSGTMHAQHGVFFKFKPSSQTTLEGVHVVTCRWIVPDTWRGDWLLLSCRATGEHSKYLWSRVEECGSARYVVGLYLEGDDGARRAARQLASAQIARVDETERHGKSRGKDRRVSRLRLASESLEQFAGESESFDPQ